ncbi:MAG: response regulator [Anaerolineae bacterium]|nr:response regulator [Anaerolineae bacterium]
MDSAQPARTVLVIDDDSSMLNVLSLILERAGFLPRKASHPHEALKLLEELKPDLIITDLMMPDMNGIDLIRAIRRLANGQAVPILLRSYRILDQKHVKEALEAGANDVMQTVVVPRELLARVQALLNDVKG